MKLKELSQRSGFPVSSVKFYLREGLLPPGEKLNATTARYGPRHLERLELIGVLRRVVGMSAEQARQVTDAVDAVDTVDRVQLMGRVQSLVLQAVGGAPPLDASGPVDSSPAGSEASASELSAGDAPAQKTDAPTDPDAPTRTEVHGSGQHHSGQDRSAPGARDIVAAMGWLEGTEDSMRALDGDLERLRRWGVAPDLDSALVYARAMDTVAAHQLAVPAPPAGASPADAEPGEQPAEADRSVQGRSRDRLATYVAWGVFSYSRFLMDLLAVAQGSHARRGGWQRPDPATS